MSVDVRGLVFVGTRTPAADAMSPSRKLTSSPRVRRAVAKVVLSSAFMYASLGSTSPPSTRSRSASVSVTIPRRFDVCITLGIWNVLASRMRFDTAGTVSRISRAATRPPPIFRQSVCEMTPLSDSASIVRICSCRSAGNWSMMRSIVPAAVVVWRVPKTRWPVSAVSIAIATVSRSRSSPTRMMSGSSRSAARSALLKLAVCTPTCRCVMMHRLFGCTNSIGSSIVMMWSVRERFTRSTSEQSVVDFPEPVGPVTSTSPFVR